MVPRVHLCYQCDNASNKYARPIVVLMATGKSMTPLLKANETTKHG